MGTPEGKYGPGWESTSGTFLQWNLDGIDAGQACCACGGGRKERIVARSTGSPTASRSNPTSNPTSSPTSKPPCVDIYNWKSRSGHDCSNYKHNNWCNSDGSYGSE